MRRPEIRIQVRLDVRRPADTVRIVGVRASGGDRDRPIGELPVPKVLEGPGFEVHVGADNRVVRVDGTDEGREPLRRLGCSPSPDDLALWAVTTGPLGDPYAAAHVTNGASVLFALHVAGRTIRELGG